MEQFGTISKVWNKFRGILSKIPCFPENVVREKYRSEYAMNDSYIGILRPFGTISEVFEKSSEERSAEVSAIPCFPESGLIFLVYIYTCNCGLQFLTLNLHVQCQLHFVDCCKQW